MKKMKLVVFLGVMLVSIFALAACSTNSSSSKSKTTTINGTKYTLLKTLVANRDKGLTDSDYNDYFSGDDSSAAIMAIVSAGNVYVNGYQIPYLTDDGTASTEELVVDGQKMMWLDGGAGYETWYWDAQKMWQGSGRDLTTTAYDFTINLGYREGEAIKLYAKEGESTASLIEFTVINTALVTGLDTDSSSDTVTITTTSETDDGDVTATVDVASDRFDSDIAIGDIVILTDDADKGLSAKKATAVTGKLVETDDIKNPQWLATDSDKAVDFSDGLIDRSHVPEYARNTQFIRGQRRLNLYDYDADVTMWQTSTGYSIGFTRGDAAKGALEYGINYAESQTSEIVVSTDGSDVSSDTYWVTQDIWDTYQTELTTAKALLEDSSATNLDDDAEILNLANALGGTEDVGQDFVQNPLGVIGSMQKGTKSS